MGRTYKKVANNLLTEVRKQFYTIISISIQLFAELGWSDIEIEDLLNMYDKVWTETKDSGTVMLQMCEDETGIELMLDGDRSFHEFEHLNYNYLGGREMPDYMKIVIANHRKQWIPSMCLAAMCISLQRVRNWQFEQISDFLSLIDRERNKKLPVKHYKDMMEDIGKSYLLMKRSSIA